ncbi:hypothetical protein V12B01_24989 [Vibrio splendidus 12B01]|uniref:hypothetical protein n=1 Tax=Vibrio splendidus TaxID=29497 RepID=UPI000066F9E6|nr:hypothetical protein [Vibrio splendidus]EAP96282.1 hypothetical protein V12B01_24989 [Vibrio splendidus 12B01]
MIKPELSLLQLPLVRGVVTVLALVATFIGILIAGNSNLTWDLSYHGFNFAVQVYSVPLKILASIIPIVGFIALYHRSEQTQIQIALATSQNIFSNYCKHLEMFREHAESSNTTVLTHANIAYEIMYPESHAGNLKLAPSFNESLHSIVVVELKHISDCYGKSSVIQEDTQKVACARLNALYSSFGIDKNIWHNLAHNEALLIERYGINRIENSHFYTLFRPVIRGLEFIVINLNNQGKFDRDFRASKQVGVMLKFSEYWSVETMLRHKKAFEEKAINKNFDISDQLNQYLKSCLEGNGATSHLL